MVYCVYVVCFVECDDVGEWCVELVCVMLDL